MTNFRKLIFLLSFIPFFYQGINAQSESINTDTVKAGKFDTGTMWTFDFPPLDYFQAEYNFRPDQQWLDHARMSALKFATYCSASFVSEDGLVMTNNHCARESIAKVSKDDENLSENGFFAEELEDERPVPGLFVDQLVRIKDVTDQIRTAMSKGTTEDEITAIEDSIMTQIEDSESESSGLLALVIPLYNGGKYSLYYYKRYTDVRLVFTPEHQLGYYGGDPDNFTYPRYNLDCSFFRVYDENGKPLKTKNYFKWSPNGAEPGEPVFVVGNPASTNRLQTVAQLEFYRDVQYPRTLELLNGLKSMYQDMINENPDRKEELTVDLLRYENSIKAYSGMLGGLQDPVLMARKRDFEKNFRSAVNADNSLKEEYGGLWDSIKVIRDELKSISNELFVLSLNPLKSPEYFFIAQQLVDIAAELKKPESERDSAYIGENLSNIIRSVYPPELDEQLNRKMLSMHIASMRRYLGDDHELVQILTGGKTGDEAVDYAVNNSPLKSEKEMLALVEKGPDTLLNGGPFLKYISKAESRRDSLQQRSDLLTEKESVYSQKLGIALFEVYGTSIPPDATFTLRISDGVIKGYPYNGTIAPPFTTFYGLYDRYYSFNKEYPWNLPEKWLNPPSDFDLSTPFNFVSTNDIIGGNSGSAVINRNGEVVGLAFDGNIQSLPGSFIFTTETNRSVSVDSRGMLAAFEHIYEADRLNEELKNGKMD